MADSVGTGVVLDDGDPIAAGVVVGVPESVGGGVDV